MRNTWLIIRREYLERVRTKAFIIFTLLTPVFMYAVMILPSKLMMRPTGTRHVVAVSENAELRSQVVRQLNAGVKQEEDKKQDDVAGPNYVATESGDMSATASAKLQQQVSDATIDGYLWLTGDVTATRKATYYTRNASDFVEAETMRNAIRMALAHMELAKAGIREQTADELMKPVDMDTLRVNKGKVSKSSGIGAFLLPLMLMMMIYMTVIIYGVAVMRSVIEEKTSRLVEVLLSSVTSKELMAGKILGVGAVGLTQMLLWAICGLAVGSPALLATKTMMTDATLPIGTIVAFPVFFVLGYLLYSSMYAALGAMVNSDEEAQQLQWPVVLPLVSCAVFASMVIRQPASPMAFWLSLFPLTSPIIMFLRICVQVPPAWQIALSVAVLVATIFGIVTLCARIYRVGILMYGKRPTLPEIVKWIKYA